MPVNILIMFILFTLSGCGSGGGGGNASPTSSQALVTLSTVASGVLASNTIKGIELYLVLPAGVTVKTDSSGKTTGGVIVATDSAAGPNTSILGNYPVTDPVSGNVNTLKIILADTDGFNPGDFAIVTCDRAAGVSPNATEFKINGFKPVDQNGTDLSGSLNIAFSVQLK